MNLEQETSTANTPALSNNNGNQIQNASAPVVDARTQITNLVREGITAAKNGDLPTARIALLCAVELDANHETALMWLASISDKPQELLKYLQRVLVINRDNERAAQWAAATKSLLAKSLIQQGAASHKEGMPEIAAQYFLQATEFEPTNETAWLWLVSTAVEPENKLSYLNRILSLNPNHEKALALFHKTKLQIARALVKKGNAAAAAGDSETAREILRDVLEYNPNLDEAWILKANLSDSADEKMQCFERVLEINPQNEAAQIGLKNLLTPAEPEFVESTETVERFAAEDNANQFLDEIPQPDFSAEPEMNFIADDVPTQQFFADRYIETPEAVDESSVVEELAAQVEAAPVAAEQVLFAPEASAYQVFAKEFDESKTAAEEPSFISAAPNFAVDEKLQMLVACTFCEHQNGENAQRCDGCGAFVRLEAFESLLTNEINSEQILTKFIENWHLKAAGRELNAAEHYNLGLAYLNLRNVKKAVGNFEHVLGLEAANADWQARISNLLAWVNENMPEALGNVSGHSGKTIMVVDDSPTVRKLIVGKLEKHGHRVISAVDGMDALSKISETVPDLILMDVTMPRLDGYQLCKLVKNNVKTKHVPVIMISGKDGFFDKVRGRMAGSTAYITKPFGPETLLQTVDMYCV